MTIYFYKAKSLGFGLVLQQPFIMRTFVKTTQEKSNNDDMVGTDFCSPFIWVYALLLLYFRSASE